MLEDPSRTPTGAYKVVTPGALSAERTVLGQSSPTSIHASLPVPSSSHPWVQYCGYLSTHTPHPETYHHHHSFQALVLYTEFIPKTATTSFWISSAVPLELLFAVIPIKWPPPPLPLNPVYIYSYSIFYIHIHFPLLKVNLADIHSVPKKFQDKNSAFIPGINVATLKLTKQAGLNPSISSSASVEEYFLFKEYKITIVLYIYFLGGKSHTYTHISLKISIFHRHTYHNLTTEACSQPAFCWWSSGLL